jgi:DNA-binding transcriptional LysR family regulator
MRPLLRRVDRVQRLTTFESAARLGSFSAAGRELGMAQPAVTRQVQALERALGVALFERASNRVTLTAAGRTLADSLDASFRSIEYAIDEVAQLDDVFVLAMPPGFAQQVVVPSLDSLQRALGDRDLRLWLYDRESELDSGAYDAAVRVGSGSWPGLDVAELFVEQVMPVAAPGLATTHGLDATSSPEDVLAAPLLHMEADGRPWMAWADWLGEFGLSLTPVRRRVVLNSWPAVLQQALAGRGVALGWAGLIEDLVEGGALSVVGPTVTSDRSYCVTWDARRSNSSIDALIGWLHSARDEGRRHAPT